MTPAPLTRACLSLAGWRYEGDVPTPAKYVCLATPHTSNWDGLLLVTLMRTIGVELDWMIKDTWVKSPAGPLLKRMGAVAIDRSRSRNMVEQMVDEFARRDRMVLAIPPEGTRARATHWKSGFYYIARGANVPVVPGYLDYGRKRAGLGAPILMTGDVRADMDRIRAFYAEKNPSGYDPSKWGPIRLREEEASESSG